MRTILTIVIITTVFLLVGCRKEVSPAIYTTIESTNELYVKPWRKISTPYHEQVRALCIFQGELYFSCFYTIGFIPEYYIFRLKSLPYDEYTYPETSTGSFDYLEKVHEINDFGTGVNTMQTIGGRMYIGGDFRLSSSIYDLVFMNSNNSLVSANLSQSSFHVQELNEVIEYNGGVLVCGDFNANQNNPLNSNNIEYLQNGAPVGMADLSGTTHDAHKFEGDLYVVGELDQLVRRNSNGWTPIDYPGKTATDRIYSIESLNDELYILGDFAGSQVLKKYSSTQGWTEINELTSFNVQRYSQLLILNNELFVVGRYFEKDGFSASIWRMQGNSWTPFGNLTQEVRDVEYYQSKYYAAASDGLYVY